MPDKSDPPRGFRIFPQKAEVEVDDELTFHLEERVRDYVARGMDPELARAAAIERLGDLHTVRQECTQMLEDDRRAARRRDWIEDLRQDLRYGVRVRAPGSPLLAARHHHARARYRRQRSGVRRREVRACSTPCRTATRTVWCACTRAGRARRPRHSR